MTAGDEKANETRAFEADVAKLLHMMVHSVYSDRDAFLRELISNAADACERLRYEAIANPELLADDPGLRISLTIDADNLRLSVEDNGISMSHDDLVQALGTIAHFGPKAFMERIFSTASDLMTRAPSPPPHSAWPAVVAAHPSNALASPLGNAALHAMG